MMNKNQQETRKRLGDIISDGFKLFISNYAKIIIPFLLFLIISIFLKVFLLSNLILESQRLTADANAILNEYMEAGTMPSEAEYERVLSSFLFSYAVLFLESMIGAVFTVIAMGSVSFYLLKRYKGEEADFWEEFKNTFRNKNLIFLILLLGIGVSFGFILLLVPGIIIFIYYILYVFTFHNEEEKGQISRASSLSKVSGAKTKILGLFIISVFITYPISFIIDIFMDLFPPVNSYTMLFLYTLIQSLPNILLGPLFICLLTPLFTHLQAKKEFQYQSGWQSSQQQQYQQTGPYQSPYRTQSQRAPSQTEEATGPIQGQNQTKKGYYCPYCGHYVRIPKKFCPNCGESLDPLNE